MNLEEFTYLIQHVLFGVLAGLGTVLSIIGIVMYARKKDLKWTIIYTITAIVCLFALMAEFHMLR